MSKQTFIMAHDLARRRAVAAVSEAPAGYVVTVAEPTRSSAINAALHAALGDIAKTREWAGRKWDIEAWKRLMVAAWSRATGSGAIMVPALDGAGVDVVYRHTSTMTQREVSDLLAYVEAWQAETAMA